MQTVTRETYLDLADKFEKAGYGSGPGISDADLHEVGLHKAERYRAIGMTWDISPKENWDYLCCFVYEKLSGEKFPASKLRGRGFRSQQNGETVAKLLRKLAEAA